MRFEWEEDVSVVDRYDASELLNPIDSDARRADNALCDVSALMKYKTTEYIDALPGSGFPGHLMQCLGIGRLN